VACIAHRASPQSCGPAAVTSQRPASGSHDLASVSPNLRSVATSMRRRPASVSNNLRRTWPESRVGLRIIARRHTYGATHGVIARPIPLMARCRPTASSGVHGVPPTPERTVDPAAVSMRPPESLQSRPHLENSAPADISRNRRHVCRVVSGLRQRHHALRAGSGRHPLNNRRNPLSISFLAAGFPAAG
jgi:hypothetical protein